MNLSSLLTVMCLIHCLLYLKGYSFMYVTLRCVGAKAK